MGIQSTLNSCIEDCIKAELLPKDAKLTIDSEPSGLGIHRFFLRIETAEESFVPPENFHNTISAQLKENIFFDIVDEQTDGEGEKSNKTNWINIAINLLAISAIIALSLLFPPSIPLTIGLASISFISTAFTAREYLIAFFRNLWNRDLANMTTTISLGWFLSLAHTIFHAISMPLASSFSMVFMSFIMPVMLIGFINGMDEIKRLVLNKAKKMQLQGIRAIFPQMSEEYLRYELSDEQQSILLEQFQPVDKELKSVAEHIDLDKLSFMEHLLESNNPVSEKKGLLRGGMIIEVKRGECFPVDCILLDGNTVVDASLLTGEPQQSKLRWQRIPAGALNLGQSVRVYAENGAYTSTVNKLLFRSNRARTSTVQETSPLFTYLYTGLIILGLVAAIVAPAALGILTIPLVMQNLMGILFSVCPCTIAIAHQLPNLIGIYQRTKQGIQLRDDNITGRTDKINTVVFDKTGTLTNGNSSIESTNIPFSSPIWHRIYLLEKAHGGEHPLAKAIINYYESNASPSIPLNDVKNCIIDSQNRGLVATVQGNRIQLGNAAFLQEADIVVPEADTAKIAQGFSPVYVAEDGVYQGVIYIQHEPRKDILEALLRLKKEGKKIIMLTGDSKAAAKGFNRHLSKLAGLDIDKESIFDQENIHAEQTPQNKEEFLKSLMTSSGVDPKGVWFVGDGLNDAPCCRIVSELGGISCAITGEDKAAYFTDISLDGSLNYLFEHNKLNRMLQTNVLQNQLIMGYSTVAFLAFIISFSIAGIAVSPIIPLVIMLTTTMFVLFNSYRVQLATDDALDKTTSWPKKLLASNLSISLLVLASSLLIGATLIATISTGGLALPAIVFTAGLVTALSSACTVAATVLFSAFALLLTSHLLTNYFPKSDQNAEIEQAMPEQIAITQPDATIASEEEHHSFNLFSRLFCQHTDTSPPGTNNEPLQLFAKIR
ncbi:Silver exporting P-type ATPase [Legionella massiliensis]|uniref:P-type Zn(2+) transporter n=2 Tax=Legionella massiliensis TaxID=1034943 RepID=A0A078L0X5_9GAMM|nr:Silver exporting P-type ATPase [Legionella massiliensis]CEE13427.1 Silver exporting P-type ATPase [Legionella massiliensis]